MTGYWNIIKKKINSLETLVQSMHRISKTILVKWSRRKDEILVGCHDIDAMHCGSNSVFEVLTRTEVMLGGDKNSIMYVMNVRVRKEFVTFKRSYVKWFYSLSWMHNGNECCFTEECFPHQLLHIEGTYLPFYLYQLEMFNRNQ